MAERVRITVASGRVAVIGEARDSIDVDGAKVSDADGETQVRGSSKPVTVRVPQGTDLFVGSASGDVTFTGVLGEVSITTASADVHVEEVASIDARTASGKLHVDLSHGQVRLRAKSARVRVGRVEGEVHIATVSGRIEIDDAAGAVSIKTVSGAIRVAVTGREPVKIETISGKMHVSLPPGVKPEVHYRSVSGKRRVEPDTGNDLVITARSVSGDVTVSVS